MKTKDFSKCKYKLPLGNLLTLQHRSWDKLWEEDLENLFEEFSPIKDYTGKKFELYINGFYMEEPKYESRREARRNNASYSAPLKVKTKLVNLKTEKSVTQDVKIADVPLLTDRGTFIIDGVERVTISQLIRSPGVFFSSNITRGQKLFDAKVIPERGAWLKISTHWKGSIGVKINRRRRVPVTTLLRVLGLETDEEIKEYYKEALKGSEVDHIEKTLEKDPSSNRQEALMEIYSRLRPGERTTAEGAEELVDDLFFNFRRYDLGKIGRWKIWERLPELAPDTDEDLEDMIEVEDRILDPKDVYETVKEMIILNKTPGATEDEIDHLGNRRVRVFTELLLNEMRTGMRRLERVVKDRMASRGMDGLRPSDLISARSFGSRVHSFFATGQMSQFMDNENPIAEIEHKRELTAKGPQGLTSERAGFEVRDVQPSHYGRVCPIQTPEGGNVGLINHLSLFARVNSLGFIESPYFKVKNGRITDEVVYMTAFVEEKVVIGSGSIKTDDDGKILQDRVQARYEESPVMAKKSELEYVDVSPEQFLSVAPSSVPFQQNNDANRALMGSNMQRQSLPLIEPEPPLVLGGTEARIARDSGLQIRAEKSGEVVAIDGSTIKVKSGKKTKRYDLYTFTQTNQNSCFHQRPVVDKGDKVKKGQVLAEGGAIADENVSIGKNMLTAIMSWGGANFEDAILVSEKLLKDDTFTSIRIRSFTCEVRDTKIGPEETTYDIPNVSKEKLGNLDDEGLIRIGSRVSSKDILVGKVSPREKETLAPEERLLKAIFGEKAKQVKNTSLKVKHGERGKVMEIKIFSREEGHRLDPGVIKQIDVEVAQLRRLTVGDKLANRHGNKGVVAKILPEEDMPFLEDGTPVEIIINPMGIVKRMNLGQVLEAHLGLAAKTLGYRALTPSFSGATVEEVRDELEEAGFPRDGKVDVYDGRDGGRFRDDIAIGYIYMMKLDHMAEDKMHMRSIGPYSLITQQPLGGKAQFGGQRFGEMEVWALESYGTAAALQEMLTIKSDDVVGRAAAYKSILQGREIKTPTVPASFNLLVNEMKSLGLNVVIQKS